ncbi:MAG: hypothetical protein ACI8RZ_000377 [Myxococcota bacterium]
MILPVLLSLSAQAQDLKDQPGDPRRQTDFSAFTIDQGQWRVGLSSLDYGLLENTQIGTNTLLWAVGSNARAKVTAIETEKLAFSFQGSTVSVHQFWLDTITAASSEDEESASSADLRVTPLSWRGSWSISPKWSVHYGNTWTLGRLSGELTGEQITGLIGAVTGGAIDSNITDAMGSSTLYAGAVGRFTLAQSNLAVEWRRSRRDSIIFQSNNYLWVSGMVIGTVGNTTETGEVGAGAAATFEQLLETLPSAVSLSWQWSFEKFNLRLGIPLDPSNPFSSTQAIKLYWLL